MSSPEDHGPSCHRCGAGGALRTCPRCGLAAHEGCLDEGADCPDEGCRPAFRMRPATLPNLTYAVLRSLIFTAIAVWLAPLILRLLPACLGLAREARDALLLAAPPPPTPRPGGPARGRRAARPAPQPRGAAAGDPLVVSAPDLVQPARGRKDVAGAARIHRGPGARAGARRAGPLRLADAVGRLVRPGGLRGVGGIPTTES